MTLGPSEVRGTVVPGAVTDADGRLVVVQGDTGVLAQVPAAAVEQNVVGANAANAAATATLPAAAGKTTYITGFTLEGLGATAENTVIATITGLAVGTLKFPVSIPAGAATRVNFQKMFAALPASAQNTAIVVTIPAAGAGNTNMSVTAYGYQL